MWNNQSGSGFPNPQLGGYNAGHPQYAPPHGPPPSGYGPPQGHPPGYGSPFSPPPGPPGGHSSGYNPAYPPPTAPPPQGNYPPPSGPPPAPKSGYPGQQYHQQAGAGYPGQTPFSHSGNPQYSTPPPPGNVPPRPPTQQQFYGPQDPNQPRSQHFFQYSQCNGKKKALCIGINYFGQSGQLAGCINDVRNIVNFLCQHYGYKREDIVTLTDDASNPRQQPTKQNIIEAMHWLVRGAAPNDALFFHYSGHGGQTKDTDGDEADGYDEVIYPVDFQQKGHIVDDMMHDVMVKSLPPGCRLTAIYDSCHSGSALDLPYIYSTEGKLKEPNFKMMAGQNLLSAATSYARGDMGGLFQSAKGIARIALGSASKAEQKSKSTRTSPADVISWSGCKDSQTSADAQEGGQATGAMSHAFVTALSQNKNLSYQQLLTTIRGILRQKYSQKPQLSSSHPIDTNYLFLC